jgi:hypothetical protein
MRTLPASQTPSRRSVIVRLLAKPPCGGVCTLRPVAGSPLPRWTQRALPDVDPPNLIWLMPARAELTAEAPGAALLPTWGPSSSRWNAPCEHRREE